MKNQIMKKGTTMPLAMGKSPKAFSKNVSTEMHSGKPQKQALAIAYAVRKRAGKKMAKGGMVENEDLDPKNEPEQGAKNAVLKQMDFSKKAEEHEDLEESKIDPGSMNAYKPKTMSLRKEPKIAQSDLSLAEQGANFAKGGEVGMAMDRRSRAIRAAMGKAGEAKKMMEAMSHEQNEMPGKNTGPSGMTTPEHALKALSMEQPTYPQANLPPEEQEANMAAGGLIEYPDPELDEKEQSRFYADGGMTGNEISSPRNQVPNLKEEYGEPPYYAPEDEGEHFAHGHMVKAIMKKRMAKGGMYAEGGPVDDMGLQDQEYDTDRFMAEHMEPSHYDHLTHEDISDQVAEENPKAKRKMMLSNIMRGLHQRHYGKE
jgi:hypothetical protein